MTPENSRKSQISAEYGGLRAFLLSDFYHANWIFVIHVSYMNLCKVFIGHTHKKSKFLLIRIARHMISFIVNDILRKPLAS